MKKRKKNHEVLIARREQQNKNYKNLLQRLYEYETSGLEYYSGKQDFRLIFTDRDKPVEQVSQEYGNPYKIMH